MNDCAARLDCKMAGFAQRDEIRQHIGGEEVAVEFTARSHVVNVEQWACRMQAASLASVLIARAGQTRLLFPVGAVVRRLAAFVRARCLGVLPNVCVPARRGAKLVCRIDLVSLADVLLAAITADTGKRETRPYMWARPTFLSAQLLRLDSSELPLPQPYASSNPLGAIAGLRTILRTTTLSFFGWVNVVRDSASSALQRSTFAAARITAYP